mgnify:FL=1
MYQNTARDNLNTGLIFYDRSRFTSRCEVKVKTNQNKHQSIIIIMFGAVAAGNPIQLSEEVPNSNGLQHTIVLSSTKPKQYSHITLFQLPNVALPADLVATVYFKLSVDQDFQLFGYLAAEKPSAIFKVTLPGAKGDDSGNLGEIDMDVDGVDTGADSGDVNNISQVLIGISVEPRVQGLAKVQQLKEMNMARASGNAMVLSKNLKNTNPAIPPETPGELAQRFPVVTQQLAANIVQHAYNYLTGFLDPAGNVSIKRFDTWWDKFKVRLANDAHFIDEVTSD